MRQCCGRGAAGVLAFVAVGQLTGHCLLTFASGHVHGSHWTLPMLSAHAVAAVGCAVLICAAERLCAAALGELRRLIVVTLDVGKTAQHAPKAPTHPSFVLVSRILVRRGLATRAPPTAGVLA